MCIRDRQITNIESTFRKKEAYSRFKALLERKRYIDKWYKYESQVQEKVLRVWYEDNTIEIDG